MQWIDWTQLSFQTMPDSYFYEFGLSPQTMCITVEVSSEGSHVSSVDSENSSWISSDQEITKILVEKFKQVPEVEFICAQFGNEEIIVWTLLEHYDRAAREKVYEKELEICELLGVHDFDFRVTSVDLVTPPELIRTGSHQIYRRQ
jgi:hypothetical protein